MSIQYEPKEILRGHSEQSYHHSPAVIPSPRWRDTGGLLVYRTPVTQLGVCLEGLTDLAFRSQVAHPRQVFRPARHLTSRIFRGSEVKSMRASESLIHSTAPRSVFNHTQFVSVEIQSTFHPGLDVPLVSSASIRAKPTGCRPVSRVNSPSPARRV